MESSQTLMETYKINMMATLEHLAKQTGIPKHSKDPLTFGILQQETVTALHCTCRKQCPKRNRMASRCICGFGIIRCALTSHRQLSGSRSVRNGYAHSVIRYRLALASSNTYRTRMHWLRMFVFDQFFF